MYFVYMYLALCIMERFVLVGALSLSALRNIVFFRALAVTMRPGTSLRAVCQVTLS